MTDKVVSLANRPMVALATPCGDLVHAKFAMCLYGLGRGARNHRQAIIQGQSSIVAHARNVCVEAAMNNAKADYIMFLDSDMLFPMNTIDRLLAHGKDIVGATYVRRGYPFDNLGHALHDRERNADTGLIEMTHIPTGILLVKMDVFRKLKPPYFRFETDEAEGKVRGEDFVFSEMTRKLGFRLWCDIDLSKEIGHIYTYIMMTKDPATREVVDTFKASMKEAVNG